jgi:orotate phosphoribosyltransferase
VIDAPDPGRTPSGPREAQTRGGGQAGPGDRHARIVAVSRVGRMKKEPLPPHPSSLGEGAAHPDRDRLRELIVDLAVVHGRVTLSSGQEADWYIDMRRLTLHHEGAPLVGRVMRQLTGDLRYDAVGGLTLGADPVATAMVHAAAAGEGFLDAFVVRKAGKAHGLQRRIEGPDVAGRAVLVVEDVSTTGGSPLTAVEALREAGAEPIAVAVIVDRGGRAAVEEAGLDYRAAYTLADLGLE